MSVVAIRIDQQAKTIELVDGKHPTALLGHVTPNTVATLHLQQGAIRNARVLRALSDSTQDFYAKRDRIVQMLEEHWA